MNKTLLYLPWAIFPMFAGSGCTNASHLLLYQHSNLGLNTGVNPSNQAVHCRVGIRREFGAIVPKWAEPGKKKGEEKYEAASAYFGSRFRVSSIWKVPEAAEVLATGQASVIAASNGRLRLKETQQEAQPGTDPNANGQAGDAGSGATDAGGAPAPAGNTQTEVATQS
jgi:hypothetical protein